jgi:hypothetical protein
MKKAYKIFVLVTLLLVSIPAFADWRFGINVSYENTGAEWEVEGKRLGVSNIDGFNIGPSVAYEAIEDYLDIKSGINFAYNGFTIQENAIFGKNHKLTLEETIRLYYLQFPLYVVGKLPIKEASLLLEVGPIFAAGVGGKAIATLKTEEEMVTGENKELFKDVLDPFNCSIHFGIGAEYMGARIIVGYNLGVYDIMKDPDNKITTDGFFVSIGYVFDFD